MRSNQPIGSLSKDMEFIVVSSYQPLFRHSGWLSKQPDLYQQQDQNDNLRSQRVLKRVLDQPKPNRAGLRMVGVQFEDSIVVFSGFGFVCKSLGVEVAKGQMRP